MKIVELILDEDQDASGIEAISIVENPAIEEDFIALKSDEIKLAEEDKENIIMSKLKTIENPKADEEGAIDKKLEELPSLLAMGNEVQA